ncbi:hypothetical protein GQ53DRAFT_74738 [Thozetella sp. PMI_491]|nr:hypothetical protein GQ53DRAFT_74738 [Thozetella sp. PMI_491]
MISPLFWSSHPLSFPPPRPDYLPVNTSEAANTQSLHRNLGPSCHKNFMREEGRSRAGCISFPQVRTGRTHEELVWLLCFVSVQGLAKPHASRPARTVPNLLSPFII